MAQRMSSPDGGEVLSVQDDVGAQILGTLGWNTESGSGSKRSSPRSSESTEQSSPQSSLSDSGESSGEQGRKRGPGRPRKHPVQEEDE